MEFSREAALVHAPRQSRRIAKQAGRPRKRSGRGAIASKLEHLSVSVWNSPIVVAVLLPNVDLYLINIIHEIISFSYPFSRQGLLVVR